VKAVLSFGIASAPRDRTERIGPAVESLGYAALWANDTRRGTALATLAVAARGTRSLRLAAGVIALSERAPARIASEVAEAEAQGLDRARLILGLGSGASRSLDLVRLGVAELRELLPGVRIAVAAVGPRMCALGGEIADTVLLNWSLPDHLAEQRGWIEAAAAAAGRRAPVIAAYVRVAVGPEAATRLREEMARYARPSTAYSRIFAAQRGLVGVAAADPAATRAGLDPYRSVLDECVVRALPATDDVDAWLAVATAAAD
jgi:alkanesulfonate monooxygenase SsuD/methylene tetrahydromethanopterin reductase-like flavin-dependent oxidoreductase (luciferase family)